MEGSQASGIVLVQKKQHGARGLRLWVLSAGCCLELGRTGWEGTMGGTLVGSEVRSAVDVRLGAMGVYGRQPVEATEKGIKLARAQGRWTSAVS